MNKIGYLYAIISAAIFGSMPLFTKLIKNFGFDTFSITFFRVSLSLPLIFLLLKISKKDKFTITLVQFKDLLWVSFYYICTILLLFNSYNYISSGAATSLHFTYPIIIFVLSIYLFKYVPSNVDKFCVAATILGVILLADFKNMNNSMGVFLALLSGLTYSMYSIMLSKNSIKNISNINILFFVNLFATIILLIISFFANVKIDFYFDMNIFILLTIYSIILTLGGASLYQKSISLIGAKNTSMLSTLEPIVSIILGYFILREQLGFNQIIAVLCIVVANFLLIKSN